MRHLFRSQWNVPVLACLIPRPRRWSEVLHALQHAGEPVTEKTVTRSLTLLCADGLVDKSRAEDGHDVYALTTVGEQVAVLIVAFAAGIEHIRIDAETPVGAAEGVR